MSAGSSPLGGALQRSVDGGPGEAEQLDDLGDGVVTAGMHQVHFPGLGRAELRRLAASAGDGHAFMGALADQVGLDYVDNPALSSGSHSDEPRHEYWFRSALMDRQRSEALAGSTSMRSISKVRQSRCSPSRQPVGALA